jgi:dipeptidyl aminopeptidase/acylaminoacyl peptidase
MPTLAKPKLLLPALVIAALLALPAGASATLSYVKNPFNSTVFVAADDGSGARKVEAGHNPHVAPNGLSVAYLHEGPKNAQELKIAPATGGPGKTVMANLREAFYATWSPDSKTIAALRGPELGKRNLVLIDVATGLQSVVASGYFSGFSFSPDGTEIAYSRAGSEKYPPRSDVFRFPVPIPGVVNVRAPEAVRLTSDHRSSAPLWGPQKIVFVKTLGKNRKYGPKNELFLMNPQGKGVKRLTHTKVPALLQGLFPTDWSADGNRLLTEFQGQDTSYAVVVNPKTGKQRPVAGTGETGFVGTALSADGSLVLGFNGGFDPGLKNHKVQTVPYSSGKPKTLVKEAFEPSWSR